MSTYTIKIKEQDYLSLMKLVMKYGTGTGHGDGTLSIGARVALADAVKYHVSDPLDGVCDTNVSL